MNRATATAVHQQVQDMAGRRRYVAVLFSDLCGSTAIAAEHDADTYADILEALRSAGTRIIAHHGGDIAQVYGDGILSLFQGASGAERAAAAALALHAAVAALRLPGIDKGLRLHSGIHSGLVLLRPGDATRGSIEAVGRTTSVAARLSAAARPGEILVSSGSLGPGRTAFATGTERSVDVGDGTLPVAVVPVLPVAMAVDGKGQVTAGARFPFIGRTETLARLDAALAGLAGGAGFRLLVAAPPGQGKTRLADNFAAMAAPAGALVLRGSCSADATVGPLSAIRQIAAGLDATAPLQVDPGPDALVATLKTRLAVQPVVVVIDDWQWADTATATALGRIRVLDGALGILLLSRERAAGALPLTGFDAVPLPPMSAAETAALVRSRRPEFDPIDAQHIHDRAGGNPLFTEELCLLDPGAARSVARSSAEPVASAWLAALVGARAEALPDAAMQVLETAAVIGPSPPRWLLDRLVDATLGAGTVAREVPLLLDQDFLAMAGNDDAVRFKHGITWEIIYSLVPLATRRQLHARIADVLEHSSETPGVDLHEALAWHFRASDQPARSWPHAERAGDRAVTLGSLDQAQVQYRSAIGTMARLTDVEIDDARYRALVGKFGYVCIFDADAAHFPVFEAASARARARGDREAEASAEYWLGYIAHGGGQPHRAIRHLERALALSDGADDTKFQVQVRATLGQAQAVATNYAVAIPLLEEAIAIKSQHRSGTKISTGLAYSLTQRGAVYGDTGDFVSAQARFDAAFALLQGESPPVEASMLGWVAAVAAWRGDWPGLLAAARRGADVALRVEAVYIHAISRAFAAYAEWQLGGGDAAADALAAAVECMVDRGKFLSLSIAYGFLAEVEVARGNPAAARIAVAGAYRRARAGDPMGVAWASRAWARHLAATDPDRARLFMARARRNAARRQSPHEAARCDLDAVRLGLCPPDAVAATLQRACDAFAAMGMTGLLAEAQAIRAG